MESQKPISHVVAGLIIAGVTIAVSLITMMFSRGATTKPGSGLLTYLIIIAGLVFFINYYGKANQYQTGFGDLFSYGFKATAMCTILFFSFLLLCMLLFPDFKTQAMAAARTAMEDRKDVSDEQVEQGMQWMEKHFWTIMIAGTTFWLVVIGTVGSLIGAAVTKKRPQNPFEQLPQ